jgi:hypothetical protein
MAQAQIDGQKFAELLLMEFPELRDSRMARHGASK